MVKTVSINATYKNKNHLFECDQRDFLEKAAEYFSIDTRDVELYSVKKGVKHKILPHDIADVMKIEIVPKSAEVTMGNQRTLRSYFDNSSLQPTAVSSIITKLRNNSPLTGQERKSMVQWLEIYSTTFSKKRKIDDISSDSPKHEVSHKKVQVNITSMNCKDSFAQTDLITTSPDEVHVRNEEISNRIKRLAVHSDTNKEEVALLMRDSFDDRRTFIFLKAPPVCAVKDKYPLLFSVNEVKSELERIFYTGKCSEFIDNMHKYAQHILPKCSPSDDLCIRTEKAVERARTDVQKQYARVVGSIFILTKLLDEHWNFIHLRDQPHGSENVYPYIDATSHTLKEVFVDVHLYTIYVEGQILCEASNLLEAILCLISSFFIFNINYPENCCRTMIVFEKLYLDANDTKDIDELTMQMVKLFKLEAKDSAVKDNV